MKTSAPVSNVEFVSVDPFLFGYSFNNVDIAFRGGVYAIRPSKTGINQQTGFPTHGVYCIQKLEVLSGDFAGEIRNKSYYVGSLAGSIPKGSPPRMLLAPSADNKTIVGGLSPEEVVALAIGEATFGEEEFPLYEGKYLLQPKDRNVSIRGDQQYGLLVESIKKLYPPSKNATPQEIAYGTTFPRILAGNTGPDFALNYGFHMRLEGDDFKTLVAVSALGPIEPTANTEAAPAVQVATAVQAAPATGGKEVYTVDSVKPLIYQVLAKGPKQKNEIINELMNTANGDKDSLIASLLSPAAFESGLWALGADNKFALKTT